MLTNPLKPIEKRDIERYARLKALEKECAALRSRIIAAVEAGQPMPACGYVVAVDREPGPPSYKTVLESALTFLQSKLSARLKSALTSLLEKELSNRGERVVLRVTKRGA